MTLNEELDGLSRKTVLAMIGETGSQCEALVRSALNEAIERALTQESSIPMMDAALQAIRAAKHVNAKEIVPQGYEYHAATTIFKAMSSALLKELKQSVQNETPSTS